MNPVELFTDLRLQRWFFWLDDGRLKFRAPQSAGSQAILEQLRANKAHLIELLQREPHTLEVYPLSYGQRALWYIWKLAPGSSAYNQSIPLRVSNDGNFDRWRRVFEILVERHPIFRTRFHFRKDEPIQQLVHDISPDIQWIDLAGMSPEDQSKAIAAEHSRPFDLENKPAVRFRVFSKNGISPDLLLVTMHHIICDGWSVELIRAELQSLYNTIGSNDSSHPPPSKYSYFDYVYAEQELLNGASGVEHLNFWREQLSTPPPPLSVEPRRSRPPVLTFDGDSISFTLEDESRTALSALAQKEEVTDFALFLSIFLLQLHRYSAQSDLLIGSFSAGRHHAEFASTVGYFVNPIVIRSRQTNTGPFRAWLKYVADVAREALEHGVVPFPWLVEKLKPARTPDRSPFFDVTYNYLSRRAVTNLQKDQSLDTFELQQADGKFDLSLTVLEDNGRIKINFGYNRNLIASRTIQRFAADFRMLIGMVSAEPETEINEISDWQTETSSPIEYKPVLEGRSLPLDDSTLLHHLFERHARSDDEAMAFSDGQTHLTYAHLHRAAACLSHHLVLRGIGSGDVVAIANQSGAAFLVAIIGIHRIGAAYLPLDCDHYPDELLRYMVTTAGAKLVLNDKTKTPAFESTDVETFSFSIEDLLAEDIHASASASVELDSTAYIIFTSGSTGRPKAVPILHRSVANYIQSMREDLEIEPSSRFALVSTLAADLGNTVLFLSLATGGCLYIVPHSLRLDPGGFQEFMKEQKIDYLKIVPSHLKALTQDVESPDSLPRKALILGGEGSPIPWVRSLRKQAPGCRIFNHYGPTEATIGVMTCLFQEPVAGNPATIPLSRCVANSSIYLIDGGGESVAKDDIGEIYIAGDCLSPGYLGNAGTSNSNFVKLPSVRGGRAYRTGDLARQLPDGSIEILGRSDRQIKLRGFRIEPVQIESAFQEDPLVSRCLAAVHRAGSDQEQLVAFIVPREPADFSFESSLKKSIRENVETRLPEHMIPGKIHLVKDIPLSPNGKADLAALFASIQPSGAEGDGTANNETERALGAIWKEVLDLSDDIGIDENFFELGGHSLLAVKLLARIEERLDSKLPLQRLLTHTTIRQLARLLEDKKPEKEPILVSILPNASGQAIVALPGAGGSIVYLNELARRLQPQFALWGMQGFALTSENQLHDTVEEAAEYYLRELRTESLPDNFGLIGHSYGALVAYEMVRQLGNSATNRISFLGLIDNPAPSAMHKRGYENWQLPQWLVHIATRMEKLYHIDLGLNPEALKNLSRNEQLRSLHHPLIQKGILPDVITESVFDRYIEIYRRNAVASIRYRPPALEVEIPMVLFKAMDRDVDLGEMSTSEDSSLEWSHYSPLPVGVVEVPGTHLSMMAEPQVEHLANAIVRFDSAKVQ